MVQYKHVDKTFKNFLKYTSTLVLISNLYTTSLGCPHGLLFCKNVGSSNDL